MGYTKNAEIENLNEIITQLRIELAEAERYEDLYIETKDKLASEVGRYRRILELVVIDPDLNPLDPVIKARLYKMGETRRKKLDRGQGLEP